MLPAPTCRVARQHHPDGPRLACQVSASLCPCDSAPSGRRSHSSLLTASPLRTMCAHDIAHQDVTGGRVRRSAATQYRIRLTRSRPTPLGPPEGPPAPITSHPAIEVVIRAHFQHRGRGFGPENGLKARPRSAHLYTNHDPDVATPGRPVHSGSVGQPVAKKRRSASGIGEVRRPGAGMASSWIALIPR
jgi:hypothetical protein